MDGYSHDHLLATQERVADELASPQGNGGVSVRHFVFVELSKWQRSRGGWMVVDEGTKEGERQSRSRSLTDWGTIFAIQPGLYATRAKPARQRIFGARAAICGWPVLFSRPATVALSSSGTPPHRIIRLRLETLTLTPAVLSLSISLACFPAGTSPGSDGSPATTRNGVHVAARHWLQDDSLRDEAPQVYVELHLVDMLQIDLMAWPRYRGLVCWVSTMSEAAFSRLMRSLCSFARGLSTEATYLQSISIGSSLAG